MSASTERSRKVDTLMTERSMRAVMLLMRDQMSALTERSMKAIMP